MKLILISFTAIFALASCNTMVGLGRDTRLLGQEMEKTAEKSAPNSDSGASGAPIY
jgi:predicted small secreted protein